MRGRPFSDKLGSMVIRIKRAAAFILLSSCLPTVSLAQFYLLTDWRGEQHMECLQRVSQDPARGKQLAEEWVSQEASAAARHCAAVAEAEIGDPSLAARSFGALAQQLPPERWSDVGLLWAQAGHAWLLAEQPDQALEAFDLALENLPENPGLLADRGVVRALQGDYAGAAADLTRAISVSQPDPELLLYRATAYRHLEDYTSALDDLNVAVEIAPNFAEAYFERGNLRELVGDEAGAVADWEETRALAPGSGLARLAAERIAEVSE